MCAYSMFLWFKITNRKWFDKPLADNYFAFGGIISFPFHKFIESLQKEGKQKAKEKILLQKLEKKKLLFPNFKIKQGFHDWKKKIDYWSKLLCPLIVLLPMRFPCFLITYGRLSWRYPQMKGAVKNRRVRRNSRSF